MENKEFMMPVHDSMAEELNMKHVEMLKDLMSQMDVKVQDDHRAEIAEREYWRKLRGDILLALLDKGPSIDLSLSDRASDLTEYLYRQDKDFFINLDKNEVRDIEQNLDGNDEKIRKSLIDMLKNDEKCYIKEIAWLEKQGTSYTKTDVENAYLKGINDAKQEVEKQYKADYQIRKDIATFIFNYRGDIKDRAKWMDYLGIKAYFVEKEDE